MLFDLTLFSACRCWGGLTIEEGQQLRAISVKPGSYVGSIEETLFSTGGACGRYPIVPRRRHKRMGLASADNDDHLVSPSGVMPPLNVVGFAGRGTGSMQ